jgi:DNA (cytosine-5)-methyltransferase 1
MSLPVKLNKKINLFKPTKMKKHINCLELFAGCGGLGYGFHQEQFNIVACNELDHQIAETYRENFTNTNVVVGDITKKNIKDKLYENFKDIHCDVIIGGPPCVAYSMSGKRNSRDPRGQLFNDYVEMVDKLKPKIFVMENVKGILTMKHDKINLTKEEKDIADKYYGLESKLQILKDKKKTLYAKNYTPEDISLLDESMVNIRRKIKKMDKLINVFRMNVTEIIKQNFNQIGYNVNLQLLNSANYGVPQKRERVIIVGTRNDLPDTFMYPEPTHTDNDNDGLPNWISVKEAIDDLKDKDEDNKILQHIYTEHSPDFIEKIKNTPIGKSVNPKYTEAFFRCEPDKPSNTVKENHGGVFVHYEKDRVMTPRELARLQSFPDSFKFKGKKSNILVQLGNAVPCKMAREIAKQVKQYLSF